MKYRDGQKGKPETIYTGTAADIEALTAAAGMIAFATDTHLFGFYNGTAWVWGSGGGGAAFWASVPGTPTRVSNTQFTITDTGNAGALDKVFQKGVVLRWLDSGAFKTGMVINSSYATDTVTINIVGDALAAGFTDMKYCLLMALTQDFIIAGTFPSAATTDVARAWYAPQDVYLLSADFRVRTAGTTNATTIDINDDGTSKFSTKPSIASGVTSDLNNAADSPSGGAVAANSLVTVDMDAVSTTPPVDGYVTIFYYPACWRYRS